MKFTDGFWLSRPGADAQHAAEAYDIFTRTTWDEEELVALAPTKMIGHRGDTLNQALQTLTLSSPLEVVIRVRVQHHRSSAGQHGFDLLGAQTGCGRAQKDDSGGELRSGTLTARVSRKDGWELSFRDESGTLTRAGEKGLGYIQ